MVVVLPNGGVASAVDPTPISIEAVGFENGDKWYINCPSFDIQTTESDIAESTPSESTTDEYSTVSTFNPDATTLFATQPSFDQSTDEYSHESTFDPDDTTTQDTSQPSFDESSDEYPASTDINQNYVVEGNERNQSLKTKQLNESNESTIVGKFSVYSKTKISHLISLLNLTLS